MFKYNPRHHKEKQKYVSLTNWISLGVLKRGITWNYQRIRDQLRKDPDPVCLQYQFHSTRLGNGRWQIKSIQCINKKTIKWFVAYGLVDKCMYLLEPGEERYSFNLRITGIFDPIAIVDNRPAHYFYNLFHTSKDTLESIVCKMGSDDRLRLCSATLILLSPKDSLPNNNYLMKERYPCLKKNVKIMDEILNSLFLRCTIFQEKRPSTPFYLLGDANERGAAFVFVVGESKELELYTRINKVPSLMNPVGQMRRRYLKRRASVTRHRKRGRPSEILLPELWGQKAKRGSGRPMIEFNEQDTTTSEEGE